MSLAGNLLTDSRKCQHSCCLQCLHGLHSASVAQSTYCNPWVGNRG